MKLANEYLLETKNDEHSIKWITAMCKQYPTEKGFRVETFMSPNFVHVKVYKMGDNE